MATIDLGPPRPTPHDLLDGLPRRVALTLPELRFVAERANGAPLPFDLARRDARTRAASTTGSVAAAAPTSRRRTPRRSASLHDPATSLSRRGLLVGGPDDGVVDEGILGAVGLLATPTVAVDLDVAAGPVQVKSWHRQNGGAVAALSTQDGLVFELAWFPTWAWAAELARAAVVPEDLPLHDSVVPDRVELPHELADAASRRPAPTAPTWCRCWSSQHRGAVTDGDGPRARRRRGQSRPDRAGHRGPRPAAGPGRGRVRRRDHDRRCGRLDARGRRVAGAADAPRDDGRCGSRWPGSSRRTSPPSWRRSWRRWLD